MEFAVLRVKKGRRKGAEDLPLFLGYAGGPTYLAGLRVQTYFNL